MPVEQSPQQRKSIVPTPQEVAAFVAKRRAYWDEKQGSVAGPGPGPAPAEQPRPNPRHAAPIEWLWPGRIARGKLTVIAGAPGSGKSTLAVRIAAAVSSGGAWPCDEGSAVRGRVVLICRDGDIDVLDPRLRAAGADVDRVKVWPLEEEADRARAFHLGHELKQLENDIASLDDLRLIVVDAVHLAGGRTAAREARTLFASLAAFARRHNVAVVAIAQAADADYLARKPARLSAFMLAQARMAFAIEVDPHDENRRLLLQMKNELAADPGTLAFGITSHETAPGQSAGTATFEAHRVGVSPHEFTARQSRSFNSAKAEAIDFLRHLFGKERRLRVRHIEAQARAFGLLKPDQPISQCLPLRDARIALGLEVIRAGFANDGAWTWAKPGAREEEQAEAKAKQDQSRRRAEMRQKPPADLASAPEQQPTPERQPAPADPARPTTGAQAAASIASPPLQPAAAQTSEPAKQTS